MDFVLICVIIIPLIYSFTLNQIDKNTEKKMKQLKIDEENKLKQELNKQRE